MWMQVVFMLLVDQVKIVVGGEVVVVLMMSFVFMFFMSMGVDVFVGFDLVGGSSSFVVRVDDLCIGNWVFLFLVFVDLLCQLGYWCLDGFGDQLQVWDLVLMVFYGVVSGFSFQLGDVGL